MADPGDGAAGVVLRTWQRQADHRPGIVRGVECVLLDNQRQAGHGVGQGEQVDGVAALDGADHCRAAHLLDALRAPGGQRLLRAVLRR